MGEGAVSTWTRKREGWPLWDSSIWVRTWRRNRNCAVPRRKGLLGHGGSLKAIAYLVGVAVHTRRMPFENEQTFPPSCYECCQMSAPVLIPLRNWPKLVVLCHQSFPQGQLYTPWLADAKRKGLVCSHKAGQLPGLLAEAFGRSQWSPLCLPTPTFFPFLWQVLIPKTLPINFLHTPLFQCAQLGIKSNKTFTNSYKYLVSVYHKLALILVLRI